MLAKIELVEENFVSVIVGDFNIDIHAKNQRTRLLQEYMQSIGMQEITQNFVRKGKCVIITFGKIYELNNAKSIYHKHIGLTVT